MSREYRFRGVDTDTGDWMYGYLVKYTTGYCEICYQNEITPLNALVKRQVIPETVGQFTGLNDKEGTPIYEGDIVTIVTTGIAWGKEYEWTGVVEFSRGAFVVKSQNGKKTNYTMFNPNRPVQVIGNQFEHPHLIK